MLYAIILHVNNSRTAVVCNEELMKEWIADHDFSWYDSVTVNKLVPEQVYMLEPVSTKALDVQLFQLFGTTYNSDWVWINQSTLRNTRYGFIAQIPIG